jgi:hypothetical protein
LSASGAAGASDARDETEKGHVLEYLADRGRDTRVELDGASHLDGVWSAAAPAKAFQALDRSIFCIKKYEILQVCACWVSQNIESRRRRKSGSRAAALHENRFGSLSSFHSRNFGFVSIARV